MRTIRPERAADREGVRAVNAAAFGGDEEADLVDRLHADGDVVVSLVACEADRLVGHIVFSRLRIVTTTSIVDAIALAPLAVIPDMQNRGIGSALVEHGLRLLRERGERIVVVLGHPHFYPRFGFSSDRARGLRAPFSGPAFMALALDPDALDGLTGDVRYATAFRLDDSAPGNSHSSFI